MIRPYIWSIRRGKIFHVAVYPKGVGPRLGQGHVSAQQIWDTIFGPCWNRKRPFVGTTSSINKTVNNTMVRKRSWFAWLFSRLLAISSFRTKTWKSYFLPKVKLYVLCLEMYLFTHTLMGKLQYSHSWHGAHWQKQGCRPLAPMDPLTTSKKWRVLPKDTTNWTDQGLNWQPSSYRTSFYCWAQHYRDLVALTYLCCSSLTVSVGGVFFNLPSLLV